MMNSIRAPRGKKGSRGFTLVELIVSTGIFTIAATVIVGALLSVEYASKKTRMIRVASDNISAALDGIGRSIRLGTYIHCGCAENEPDNLNKLVTMKCPRTDENGAGGSSNLCLRDQEGADQLMYRLFNGRIQRSRSNGAPGTFEDITADNINITNLKFQVNETAWGFKQPSVTMLVVATVGTSTKEKTTFRVQTAASQRTPNNQ